MKIPSRDCGLVVNFHVTEACNYGCTHCFAKWARSGHGVFSRPEVGRSVVQQVIWYFDAHGIPAHRLRLNFVGGEPGLLPGIGDLLEWSAQQGVSVSYVTNGLMLDKFDADWTSATIDVIGLSVDSGYAHTNLLVGRRDAAMNVPDLARLLAAVEEARASAASTRAAMRKPLQVKLNTVVSRHNASEDLNEVVAAFAPDRWKVLRVLPVFETIESITDAQFDAFVRRHQQHRDVMVVEDNDHMIGSYIMVNPRSQLFWTEPGHRGYRYSAPITEVGADVAFKGLRIDWPKYRRRYPRVDRERTAVAATEVSPA